jgi:CheY-like chemotaxis protein
VPQKNVPVPDAAEFYGNETLLVVDDDPTVLTVTVKLLKMFGYTILTATDGVEAVAVFEAHRDEIQVVVTDLMMPRMNGREAIKLIRRQKPDLPVILASGYTDDIIDLAAIEALDVIFLQKPLLLKKLLAAIRTGLNRAG